MTRSLRASLIAALPAIGVLATCAAGMPLYYERIAGPPSQVFMVLPDDRPEPRLDVTITETAAGTYRLDLETEHFQFTDLCITNADPAAVGHAHVYLGDRKLMSTSVPIVEIGPLPEGEHVITVSLRGQDHRALLGASGLVEARASVLVAPVLLAASDPSR